MAVSKKHQGPVSQKSGRSKPATHATGAGKPIGKKQVAATVLGKAVEINCDADTNRFISPKTSGVITDEFKLTILTKEELENSRIKAYSYIL